MLRHPFFSGSPATGLRSTPGLLWWLGWLAAYGLILTLARPAFGSVKRNVIAEPALPITVDIDEPSKPDPNDPTLPPASKVLQDTVWIADWSFDGASCNSTGWVKYDNRIRNNGSNYWVVDNRFNGVGNIINRAAVLSKHDLCWARDGYGNDWDYSVILKYKGAGATLTFDFLSDSEPTADFVTVEADSAGASEARVNYAVAPQLGPEAYRVLLFETEGPNLSGSVSGLNLPDFGVPATTHEVYIRFESDPSSSDEDGYYPSALQAGLAVDNVVVTGTLLYSENFEGILGSNITLANTAPATPFGEFARLFSHVTDNDKCNENLTCSWLVTDPARIAFFPDMAFGPGSAIVRNWLDDVFVSPWVSIASTPTATGTSLSYRMFPGNRFTRGKIVQQWRVRSRVRIDNTDSAAPGDSVDCVTAWSSFNYSHLDQFQWDTQLVDLTPDLESDMRELQISFRITDWQWVSGDAPPATLDPGPGPYIDRVRIGRRVLTGPALSEGPDARTQAQDCFPTVQNAIVPGEHFSPDGSNRFGTCAFSAAADLGVNFPGSPNIITGDSITLRAKDARGVGGVTAVTFHGAITSGPHAGKAPAPYTVGGNGFFAVTADSARAGSGVVIRDWWFVDLDDTYFRGGDALEYFWSATDAGGGFASMPPGLVAQPASVTAARHSTGGLHEVNYLPTINWAPAYLARIAADLHGDLNPTGPELASSTQRNCILYVNNFDSGRRSSQLHRTSFMYALDRLGYRDNYDVYDEMALGNTNAALGSRANVPQASGYSLIIHDAAHGRLGTLPDGSNVDFAKVNQQQWYRDYLAQGVTSLAGQATVWMLGDNIATESPSLPLLTTDMGLSGVTPDQGLNVNPDVHGIASFTFQSGSVQNFTGNNFSLSGGCPTSTDYDGLGATGTAVITHRYFSGATQGPGAVVMNKNAVLKWNTVFMSFTWYDIRDVAGPPGAAEQTLLTKILSGTLPAQCLQGPDPTDVPDDPEVSTLPAVTALYPCRPNPFNPTTEVRFDLSRRGPVRLEVFDAAGRLVRTLVHGELEAGRHRTAWNGMDTAGNQAPSGVYFSRLVSEETTQTQKMVLLK